MASPYKRPMFLSPSDSRSGNAVPQLTHPTFEDSSEDRFSDKARILCIDDNGYYTFPSLLILHHIMNRVKSLSDEPEARPCENFDLICGAGFGGILALFFGRLGMTVGQCENWFAEHRRKLMPVGQAKTMLGTGRKMLSNNKALEQAVKSAIRSVGLPEDTPLADPSLSGMHVSKSDTPTCRVFVLAMHPGDIHEPVRLRSYSSRMDPIAASCCIWEAAVATEASPSYYVPIKMGHPPLSYTSSGLGYCNPSKEGLDEAVRIWQLPGVRCLVSLGTGKIPPRLEHKSIPTVDIGIFNLKKFLSLINTISAIATDTQRVHNEITRDATLLGFKYFRFEGLEGVPYKSSYNASSLERISASVARYVQSEKASELLAFCARHLNSSRADDHWLSNLISRAQRPSLSPGYSNRSQNLSQERSILSFKSAPEIAHPSQDSKVLDSEHIPPTREKEDKRHIESSADEWIMRIRERIHPLVEKRHRDNDRRVKIAILDSGVDLNHPDIAYASRQVDGSDSRIKATKDWTLSAEGCHDINGHGTFCTALILEISPYADVHVAKVFDSGVATAETAGYVAEAIEFAVETWQVDIIVMPFGFRQRQESITKAVYQAYNKDVIMLAAASNDGSLERMAFPARLNQVLCVCSADGYGTSSLFNPLPNMAEDNFTILGERVLSAMLGGDRIRKSGTSVATAVAAGIAALVLQLGFQRPTKLREADLRSYAGMRAIFVAMSQEQGTFTADGRYFIRPWILLDRDKDLEYVLMHISYILEKL